MPTIPEMARSLGVDSMRWAAAGFPITHETILAMRRSRCDRCPEHEETMLGGRCRACGCFGAKLNMDTAKCPRDLWGGLEPLRPGLLRYDIRDALRAHYAGAHESRVIAPASELVWRLAVSGLARPASRVGWSFAAVAGCENPLAAGDVAPIRELTPGAGHVIQRLCRGNGLTPDCRPRGCIVCAQKQIKKRVAVDANGGILEAIKKHLDPALELVMVPGELKEAIKTLATAQYFVGQPGDSMHLAAVMNLRSIIVVPEPVYLPQLVAIGDGSEWLYPQFVHLTLHGKTLLTPELSATSLAAALAGDVYPFWHDAYLGLGTWMGD